MGTPGTAELRGLGVPAPHLHAGDRDHDGLVGRHQHAEIEDAVLLGADQLLAIEEQDRSTALIDEPQLRDAALLRDLGHTGAAAPQRLVEEQVIRLGDPIGEQGEETQVAVGLGLPQIGFGQTLGNGGHGDLPRSGRGRDSEVSAYRWLNP